MYRSRAEVERKLRQAKYIHREIEKFRGRVFVRGGVDDDTGAYPLLTHIGSFLAHARSVFQYAHKEAAESGKLSLYDDFVRKSEVIKFFKKIRDSDIHEYSIGTHMTISGDSPIVSYDPQTGTAVGRELRMYVEPLSDLDNPKERNEDVEVTITLGQRLVVDDSLIGKLESEGKTDLAEAAKKGEELFEEQECNGETDIFRLCQAYIEETETFIEFGTRSGFIT